MKHPYTPESEPEPDELPEAPPAPEGSPLDGYHFLLMVDGAAVSLHASVEETLEALRALLADHLEHDVSVHRVVPK